jgi:diacylglycerol kinase family enzyme
MGGIGIVSNPRAAGQRRDPATRGRLARLLGGDGVTLEAATPEALARAVEALVAARIDTLGIDGGDGTGHLVLTALAAAWGPAPLPRLLPLCGGTMNVLAANHGVSGQPAELLAAFLARRRAGVAEVVVERDLLRVQLDDQPPTLGFLFATGAAVAFLERFYATGSPAPLRAWLLLAHAAGSVLRHGTLARALTRREPLRVVADDDEWPDGSYLTVLAGTVPSPGLGFRPLGRCQEQPGFFHAVGVHGSLAQLLRSVPRIRRGDPWRRRAALDAVTRSLTIEGEGVRSMIDGDLYGPARRLRLDTGPAVQVIRAPPRTRPAQASFDPAGARD